MILNAGERSQTGQRSGRQVGGRGLGQLEDTLRLGMLRESR